MKKLLLLTLFITSSVMYSQEPYRTLTVSTTNGSTIDGQFMSTMSANLSYEIKNKVLLNSWTGINYNYDGKSGWISNITTLNKSYNTFNIGVGVVYNSGFVGFIEQPTGKTYGVITIKKSFKL
jgi:hypothetical protein|tara:strand:- start:582 stop:950 length:369 start_codon:yes stop_codon:yes gene_type:complete